MVANRPSDGMRSPSSVRVESKLLLLFWSLLGMSSFIKPRGFRVRSIMFAMGAVTVWVSPALALDGQVQIHDPSTIIACDGKYYTFGTGGSCLVSDDGWTCRYRATMLDQATGGPMHSALWPFSNSRISIMMVT